MITLTDSAQTRLAQLLQEDTDGADTMRLRISVRSGGCSGFSYDMCFDSELSDDDVVSGHGGVEVVLDAASLPLIQGATLDFEDSLSQSGFKITNPNATRTCGCGKSFS
jgi:iron-sulfur cluster assembly protein/iron-sulfur cluster insertion protein